MVMKIVYMFPGQGSQKVGMGLDIYEKSDIAKNIFNKVNELLGRDLTNIIFNGPQEELNQTKNTQISVFTVSVALTLILEETLKKNNLFTLPFACCGHSLGEFTALWYAGVMSFDTLVKIVSIRGELMQTAPAGAMAAVLNLPYEKINELLEKNNLKNKIVIANHNSPSQFVLSGALDEINKLPGVIQNAGGKAIILPVSGAFHSPLMEVPSKNFIEKLNRLSEIKDSKIPIYQNFDAKPSTNNKTIIEKLKNQMISPVLWTQTINNLVNDSTGIFIEIGPGKVLTGLVNKINPNIPCYNITDLGSINEFIKKYEHKLLSPKSPKT